MNIPLTHSHGSADPRPPGWRESLHVTRFCSVNPTSLVRDVSPYTSGFRTSYLLELIIHPRDPSRTFSPGRGRRHREMHVPWHVGVGPVGSVPNAATRTEPVGHRPGSDGPGVPKPRGRGGLQEADHQWRGRLSLVSFGSFKGNSKAFDQGPLWRRCQQEAKNDCGSCDLEPTSLIGSPPQ